QNDRLMQIVIREVDRLNELVEDFLAFARPRELRFSKVDLRELVEETVSLATRDENTEGVRLACSITRDAETLVADEDAVRQIMWNLVRNAVEANGGKGAVTIHAASLFAGINPEPFIEISVADEGEGLSEAVQEKLFQPFFTTKENGSGLGLATVHRLIEAHSGMIWAENNAEGGAIFRVMLPSAPSPELVAEVDITGSLPTSAERKI
ncbi:MAG: hypothetical protein KC561_21265, partial [Myxococcales bacterium]|nr:hypothetical protein [Myxococcales bacterium]